MSTPDSDFISVGSERGISFTQKDILLTKVLESSCRGLKDIPVLREELIRDLISGNVRDIELDIGINNYLVDKRFRQSLWEIGWVSAFGEHVPHDFEQLAVGKELINDSTLVSAGLIHPNWIVANDVAKKSKLSDNQLTLVMLRSEGLQEKYYNFQPMTNFEGLAYDEARDRLIYKIFEKELAAIPAELRTRIENSLEGIPVNGLDFLSNYDRAFVTTLPFFAIAEISKMHSGLFGFKLKNAINTAENILRDMQAKNDPSYGIKVLKTLALK